MNAPSRVVVLMYHGLHETRDSPGRFDPRYSVTPRQFQSQIQRLASLELADWMPDVGQPLRAPPPSAGQPKVLITFDDGDISNVEQALPLLQAAGLAAVFFITQDHVGQPGMISQGQLRSLADAGMVIGSHGRSHRFLSTLPLAALNHELRSSREFLEQITACPVALLSLPGGRGGPRESQAALDAGYHTVFGSRPGDNAATPAGGPIDRVVVTRQTSEAAFARLVRWQGPAAWQAQARYHLLGWPKQLLGDQRYDRLRQALLR